MGMEGIRIGNTNTGKIPELNLKYFSKRQVNSEKI